MAHLGALEQAIAVVPLTIQILRPGIAVVTEPFAHWQLPVLVARAMHDSWIGRVLVEWAINGWPWLRITLINGRNDPVLGCCHRIR